MSKPHLGWLASLAVLFPLGAAVAEYAGDSHAASQDVPSDVRELVEVGNKVAASGVAARKQVAEALDKARSAHDVLLATCLADKLQQLHVLEKKAAPQIDQLNQASDASEARQPFVRLTVIGQKVALTLQQAANCVGGDELQADISAETIAAPTDPSDFLPSTDVDNGADVPPGTEPIDIIPPPPTGPGITDVSPSTDLPTGETPAPPPDASPTL